MATSDIFGYLRVDDRILTAGQPTEAQLRDAAGDGVSAVINLATHDPQRSLPDEGGLARSLGMVYLHIPVDWENPTPADFEQFVRALAQLGDQRVLIHCAANYRVTAFYSLYAMKLLGWSAEQAAAFRARVWRRRYPVWEAFIEQMQAQISGPEPEA